MEIETTELGVSSNPYLSLIEVVKLIFSKRRASQIEQTRHHLANSIGVAGNALYFKRFAKESLVEWQNEHVEFKKRNPLEQKDYVAWIVFSVLAIMAEIESINNRNELISLDSVEEQMCLVNNIKPYIPEPLKNKIKSLQTTITIRQLVSHFGLPNVPLKETKLSPEQREQLISLLENQGKLAIEFENAFQVLDSVPKNTIYF